MRLVGHSASSQRRRFAHSPVAVMAQEYKAAGYEFEQIHVLLRGDGFSISKQDLRNILSAYFIAI